jgi:hypothetical protein
VKLPKARSTSKKDLEAAGLVIHVIEELEAIKAIKRAAGVWMKTNHKGFKLMNLLTDYRCVCMCVCVCVCVCV